MRIQLWSYNYAPEPQGIAPLSEALASSLVELGHDVTVVAAHPHYPEPAWGKRVRPYRERHGEVQVLRLPLWPGRESGIQRVRQEATFTLSLAGVAPLLPDADAVIAVSPCFPALAPAIATCRARRIPLVMWLQDIVTDGAATTGELAQDGMVLRGARWFERRAYDASDAIVVISNAFRDNLVRKGVPEHKLRRVFNPSSRQLSDPVDVDALLGEPPRIIAMGNIGHSQGLDRVVRAFEADTELEQIGAEFVIAGSGVAAPVVRDGITTDRVTMPGVLYGDDLLPVLRSCVLGVVSQRAGIVEFNLPSKLMTYMACGVPVIASVNPMSETARIVRESGAGWVTDAAQPEEFAAKVGDLVRDPARLRVAARAGLEFAHEEFAPESVARRFEGILRELVEGRPPNTQRESPQALEAPASVMAAAQ